MVYDDYPTRYLTFTRRKHRWIRGDWQLLPWLTRRVPGPGGSERNRLSLLSRWKIVDNLRRSLVETAQLALLVAGWTLLPVSPLRWTLLGIGAVAAPWVVSLLLAVLRPPLDKSWRAYYAAVGRDARTSVQQVGLALLFLPHQAFISADAIVRTLWRMTVSHRHLLEWRTASQIERGMTDTSRGSLAGDVARGGAGAPASCCWRCSPRDIARWCAVPLLAAWLISPSVAHALGAPPLRQRPAAAARHPAASRFGTHSSTGGSSIGSSAKRRSWLAPDNFQEDPEPIVALRTSPTNIGLQLLATVSACDLGFITLDDMVDRLELVFRSLERMRRFRGHFYNWYDLRDLSVLEPAYVSTVDSGNLAGHLHRPPAGVPRAGGRAGIRRADLARARDRPAHSPRSGCRRLPAAAAVEHLRAARATLATSRREPASSAALTRLAQPLRDAEAALTGAALAAESAEPAVEWISWSLRLVEAQSAGRRARRAAVRHPARARRHLGRRGDSSPASRRSRSGPTRTPWRWTSASCSTRERKLFAIGFQQATHALDGSYYDLLASEARLASFIAIAKNDVPAEHWFRLGRTLTYAAGEPALVSWSGSMFEYLMPLLVMRVVPVHHAGPDLPRARCAGRWPTARERGVPWGMSESAYNVRDRHQTYQYRAVRRARPRAQARTGPGARGRAVRLRARDDGRRRSARSANLAALGARRARSAPTGSATRSTTRGPTPARRYAVVGDVHGASRGDEPGRAHQHADRPDVAARASTPTRWSRSAELLLHERIPRRLVLQEPQGTRRDEALPEAEIERPAVREIDTPDTPQPHVALLGHLPYTIMVSHCGAGYSRYEELAVTRWRADAHHATPPASSAT